MLENERLNSLKDMLGINVTDSTKDTTLKFALEDVTNIILDHCHIDEIPTGLETTLIRMARELYINENLGSEAIALGSVSSVNDGNTSTSFRSAAAEFKDSLVQDYKKKLNRYRKVLWTQNH